MPIINPPITEDIQEDSWKAQATEIIRRLEIEINELQIKVIDLEARVTELE